MGQGLEACAPGAAASLHSEMRQLLIIDWDVPVIYVKKAIYCMKRRQLLLVCVVEKFTLLALCTHTHSHNTYILYININAYIYLYVYMSNVL